MLLHDSRRDARVNGAGELVLLEEQDRSRWDQEQIVEALPLVAESLRGGPGAFAVQAAIAAVHCQAARPEQTDWARIVGLYDVLERLQPSAIVSLNRAVAVAMVDGPESALKIIDGLAEDLDEYHLLHAARAAAARGTVRGRRPRATGELSIWSRTTAKGDTWKDACGKCKRRHETTQALLQRAIEEVHGHLL